MTDKLTENYENSLQTSCKDALTGLPNYGFFVLSLEKNIKKAVEEGKNLSLALLSIDAFSEINRKYGIIKADSILSVTGKIIAGNIRPGDLAGRLHSDNFAISFFDTDTDKAFEIIDGIKNRIKHDLGDEVTLSAGVSEAPSQTAIAEVLIANAKEALLQAKLTGFNETNFFSRIPQGQLNDNPTILVADDDPKNLKIMKTLLDSMGYRVMACDSGAGAVSIIRETPPDLVILDVMMPGMDGFEICKRLKSREGTRQIPIILLTALNDRESKIRGIESGADDFISKPADKSELLARIKSLINVKNLNRRLASFENILFSIANTVEAKDRYTRGHIRRVADLAVSIGKSLGMARHELESLWIGGILHDIGKIATPLEILNKPGALDDEEREIMKKHPHTGYLICHPLKKNLKDALDIIRHHHELLDGTGYPDMLKGDEISPAVRIMVAVDIFDALTTERPYRKALSREEAFGILDSMVNKNKIDAKVVDALKKSGIKGGM
ncbi:HD domain-containing phosphohydrolase [Desulforegula conservatrix]|uniref:HD domain-containing phosphohydrolase n=1 Tax=Desulforegula conservatrix TaxID=153026 RepID=UPI000426B7C6|nr:HD domain-containing phosphohydrolase [Desulforegula conservatrix]